MAFYDWVSENAVDPGVRPGPVKIGWLLDSDRGGVVFDDPERVRSVELNRDHAKSASRCPAVINVESRYFQVKCPFDMRLKLKRGEDGKYGLANLLGDKSPVRPKKLRELLTVVSEAEWRLPDRPTIQILTPYIFVSDEPVYMSQLPPFFHFQKTPWPGTLFCGRVPIHVWPRQLVWAFEWVDIERELVLTRGEPWFYVQFETLPQERPVQLIEAEETPELRAYLDQITGAVNYVNQTFSLFKTAEKRRPTRLVSPRER
ncbi:MAG: hypothetical protein AAFW46_00325 [Pseudomonadota bacterium]